MPHRKKGTPWPEKKVVKPKPPKISKKKQAHIDEEQERISDLIKSMYSMNRRQRRRLAKLNSLPMSVTPKFSFEESKKLEKEMQYAV